MLRRTTSRRRFLLRVLQACALLSPPTRLLATARAGRDDDARFITRALELSRTGNRRGDGTPYGALVVRDGEIIAEGWNRTRIKRDATAHAEVEAIQAAARVLGRRDLTGCTLYTNGGRPCPMCEGAAYFARVDRLVFGRAAETFTDAGRPRLGGC